MAADLLGKIRGEIDARLREVRPLLAEYERLLVAASALEIAGEGPLVEDPPAPPRRVAQTPAPTRVRAKRTPPLAGRARRVSTPTPVPSPAPAPEETSEPDSPRRGTTVKRARRGAAAVAIVAALEHGSHTVSELAVVTAMSGPVINNNLRRLQQAGTIVRTKRAGDGKAAYALVSAPV
jgi:hypothetical protein